MSKVIEKIDKVLCEKKKWEDQKALELSAGNRKKAENSSDAIESLGSNLLDSITKMNKHVDRLDSMDLVEPKMKSKFDKLQAAFFDVVDELVNNIDSRLVNARDELKK